MQLIILDFIISIPRAFDVLLLHNLGDVNSIKIGDRTTIGEHAMIHCTSEHATTIGDRVIVGSGAIIHGCTLEDESVVGMGSQVMDGAVVQKHAMVAAGSIVTSGKIVLSGQLWMGIPAVYKRDLTMEEISNIAVIGEENAEQAVQHALENAKTWQVIEEETYDGQQVGDRNPDYFKRLTDEVTNERRFLPCVVTDQFNPETI
jgi:gamma-carbonic anhydrase